MKMSQKSKLEIKFVDVKDIKYTKDNARKISEESLNDLEQSIKLLGVIRPLILNDKMELMSGNQRTKILNKLKIEQAPAIIMKNIAMNDYINFTLLVNSIENNKSKVTIANPEEIEFNKFIEINTNRIKTLEFKNPVVRRDIASSIVKYGQWGNVIINEMGGCIFNSDYASVMETIGYPLVVYKVTKEQEQIIKEYFYKEYGVYCYDQLNLPSYPQTYVQPQRVLGDGGMGNGMRSILYDEIATLRKNQRIIDFGSGKKAVPNYLNSKGYNIDTYEPFYKVVGQEKNEKTYFDLDVVIDDINTINQHIKEHGLYDVVMLEAVLNSTIAKKYELYVLAVCNALMNENGVLYLSTRSLKRLKQMSNTNDKNKQAIDSSKRTFELDENGMYLSYRNGHYTGQKFHDAEQLLETLKLFFEDAKQVRCKDSCCTTIFFECRKPKKIDEEFLKGALNEEFNMEYPEGYKHNKHIELVNTIIKYHKNRIDSFD